MTDPLTGIESKIQALADNSAGNTLPFNDTEQQWASLVAQLDRWLEDGTHELSVDAETGPESSEALQAMTALRAKLNPRQAYALDVALRYANAHVLAFSTKPADSSEIGTSDHLSLWFVPVSVQLTKAYAGRPDQAKSGALKSDATLLDSPSLSDQTRLERALLHALRTESVSQARMAPVPVDLRDLEELPAPEVRLAIHHLDLLADSLLLKPAQLLVDNPQERFWLFWPVVLRTPSAPTPWLAGPLGETPDQRGAWLSFQALMAAAVSEGFQQKGYKATAQVHPAVSWAQAPEQHLRLRLLALVARFTAERRKSLGGSLTWECSETRVVLRAFSDQARWEEEVRLRPGQEQVVTRLFADCMSRFPDDILPARKERIQQSMDYLKRTS